eukprot:102015-Pelagomonas_calceolata.AAC.2
MHAEGGEAGVGRRSGCKRMRRKHWRRWCDGRQQAPALWVQVASKGQKENENRKSRGSSPYIKLRKRGHIGCPQKGRIWETRGGGWTHRPVCKQVLGGPSWVAGTSSSSSSSSSSSRCGNCCGLRGAASATAAAQQPQSQRRSSSLTLQPQEVQQQQQQQGESQSLTDTIKAAAAER